MDRVNQFVRGGVGTLQQVLPLGTGAVATQTKVAFEMPYDGYVKAIRYKGQAVVTATALTAEAFARTTAGATGNSLQSAATDITFDTSAAIAKTGVAAALTATKANLSLVKGQMIEVTLTADTCSAGPGDLLVAVDIEPRIR